MMNNKHTELTKKKCVPCEGGVDPFNSEQINEFLDILKLDWEVVENTKIKRSFEFKSFSQAINFVKQIAEIAEEEGHHPDLHILYKTVEVELWTHAIKGLSINDFIIAAKIENLL